MLVITKSLKRAVVVFNFILFLWDVGSIFNVKIQKRKEVALSNKGYYGIYHFFAV
jgi:hypothetical protein